MRDLSTGRRPRLNWLSPLRPARTDVAHYALRTLPALARHFELVVWAERRYWPPEMEAYADVRHWDVDPWPALNAGDVTVYHIGNNARFHGWIWKAAQRHPGVVVLHDTRLHDFLSAHLDDGADGYARYLGAIRRCHGDEGARRAGEILESGAPASSLDEILPLTALALERARGAVVHTDAAFQQVAAVGRCPVLQLDLPYQASQPAVARSWDGTLRLVVFGYIGTNRRVESLLEAMASFPDRQRIRLTILGELEHPDTIAERIRSLSLGDIVNVRGFVTEPELDAELDRAHLAVNLRYPTMGEASGSQLRIWDRGLASVVTRTGWYAELPADSVWFVDPSSEVEQLQQHFSAAFDNPNSLWALGEAGRRCLEARHDPAVYAGELANGIERMMRTQASVAGEGVGAIARVLADTRITGDARVAVAKHAADELSRWVAPPAITEGTES